MNSKEQRLKAWENNILQQQVELDKRKADFETEVDVVAERKIEAEKKLLHKKNENELEKLQQEQEAAFAVKIDAEKAKLQEEYKAEEVKWDRIRPIIPQITVLTAFLIAMVLFFNQCKGAVKNENRALETQVENLKAQVEAYERTPYYVCTENCSVILKDGGSLPCEKGNLVILLESNQDSYKVISRNGREGYVEKAEWIKCFSETAPFFIADEI